jgi:hypothetical protein
MYGGEGQKGARIDPRSSRARRETARGTRGGPPRMAWALAGVVAVVTLGVILILALSGSGGTAETTLGLPDDGNTLGRLDCRPGVVVTETVSADGRGPKAIMQSVEPTVASLSQDPISTDMWWGYDASEKVVARIVESAAADQYEVASCAG